MEAEPVRSADRLVAFTDAVVAIAITLLALPLIEFGPEVVQEGLPALLREKALPLLGLVFGFFVIARLWWAHHRIFEHVVGWTGGLVLLTIFWLFTVVLLSPATAITTSFPPTETPGAVAIYLGLSTVSSALLSAMSLLVLRRPELTDGHDDEALARAVGSVETTIGFLLALVIGTLLPAVNYFALFVLAITGQADRFVLRALRRRRRTRSIRVRG